MVIPRWRFLQILVPLFWFVLFLLLPHLVLSQPREMVDTLTVSNNQSSKIEIHSRQPRPKVYHNQHRRRRRRRQRVLQSNISSKSSSSSRRRGIFGNGHNSGGVSGGGLHTAFDGGPAAVRCIVQGEPVIETSVSGRRRRPAIRDRTVQDGFALVAPSRRQRTSPNNNNNNSNNNNRRSQVRHRFRDHRGRQPRDDVYWPSVGTEDYCFYGVFAIPAEGTPSSNVVMTPTIGPAMAPSISSAPSVEKPATSVAPREPTLTPTIPMVPTSSSAPSLSKQPSIMPSINLNVPSLSLQPSQMPSEGAAAADARQASRNANANNNALQRILKSNTLSFAFFQDATNTTPVRRPTSEEMDGLLVQVKQFYARALTSAEIGFKSLELEVVRVDFENNNNDDSGGTATPANTAVTTINYRITIVLDMMILFRDSTPTLPIPSTDQIMTLLQAADYVDFIERYVWAAEPLGSGLFFETQAVKFGGAGTVEY